jgi:hypothetical protein
VRNIVVQFDLPYHIQVSDSFESNKNDRFYPVIDNIPAELRFKSNVEDAGGVAIAGTAAGDRHGNLGYSSVQVWFDSQFIKQIPDEFEDELPAADSLVFQMGPARGENRYLIEKAMKYLNKFLQIYRYCTKFYWIRPLAPHEITRFQLVERFEDGSEDATTQFVTQSAVKSGALDDEIIDRVKFFATNGMPDMLFYELILDAENKIDRGELNSAIVDSATMFETWVKSAFEATATAQGYSRKEATSMISKGDDSDEYLSPKNIVRDQFPKLDYSLSKLDVFEVWDEQTRKVRNKVVHEGYQSSFEEARKAQDAAVNAVFEFSQELSDELEGTKYMLYEPSINPLDISTDE